MKQNIDMASTVYVSESKASADNLATEEFLLSAVRPGEQYLFLYENDPAVVIGRFQNPWRECRTGAMRRGAIALRRRISGGGTVFHGPGNLNISFISGTRVSKKEENLQLVIRALSSAGIEIEMNQKYDLLIRKTDRSAIESFKTSGSAFRQTAASSMHHATLLIHADLQEMDYYLHGSKRNFKAPGIVSHSSPVANLSDIAPELTVSSVIESLAAEWENSARVKQIDPSDLDVHATYRNARKRLLSIDWVWGKTPGFREMVFGMAGVETLHFEIDVVEGRIAGITCTDERESMAVPDTKFLIGCPYHGPEILAACTRTPSEWLCALARVVDG